MSDRAHWEDVYSTKAPTEVSWYRAHLDHSLSLIDESGITKTPGGTSVLDVGGGASTLAGDLLERGFENVSVLDLSQNALEAAKTRLGAECKRIQWICADAIDTGVAPESVLLWHDRAVFHFLTSDEDRTAYVREVARCVAPGGSAILATFADDGPEKCSGLPVRRHTEAELSAVLSPLFERVQTSREVHTTPWGSSQSFVYALFTGKRETSAR